MRKHQVRHIVVAVVTGVIAAAIAFILAVVIANHDHENTRAACKAAMWQNVQLNNGVVPAECNGLSDEEKLAVAKELIGEVFGVTK